MSLLLPNKNIGSHFKNNKTAKEKNNLTDRGFVNDSAEKEPLSEKLEAFMSWLPILMHLNPCSEVGKKGGSLDVLGAEDENVNAKMIG